MIDAVVTTLQSIVAFVLVLAPLVFVHELGHFLVAKMLGIGVPVFSLGFGPRIAGFERAGTDYRLSLFPLGGYVRLRGDEADEERVGAPDEFLSRSRFERFLVYVAGAVFNVVLAFLVLWFLFGWWGKPEVQNADSYPTVVALAEPSNAVEAGIRVGDRIVAVAGEDVRGRETFQQVANLKIVLAPDQTVPITVERDGTRLDLPVRISAHEVEGYGENPGWNLDWGSAGVEIVETTAGSRGEEAGILVGDLIVAANGEAPIGQVRLREILADHPERAVELEIVRGEERIELTVVPEDHAGKGLVGIGLQEPMVTRKLGWGEAARESVAVNVENSKMLFAVLKRMVTGEVPIKTVSGPIGIARYARRAIETSPSTVFWLLGFFSLQLGILNLLPIPVLDGGHIAILGIESVLRRDLSDRVKERVMQAGLVFLLGFMVLIFALDIGKLGLF